MNILVSLTYYIPHISGLTVYVKRLSEQLVKKDHSVTIITSQFSQSLPQEETIRGVTIKRVPVTFRVNKGVWMQRFASTAYSHLLNTDIVHLHLPSLEASLLAFFARIKGIPVITTYHCDLRLPNFPLNKVFNVFVVISQFLALMLSNVVIAYTEDFAQSSKLLRLFKRKITVIPPPVIMSRPDKMSTQTWQEKYNLMGVFAIGMATRIAQDKGIEYMLEALPIIKKAFPRVKLLFAGEYKEVVGENRYITSLQPLIKKHKDSICFLGVLPQEEMPFFYDTIRCLVVSSINSTESFGLVQVEAMLCGTPVVATNLPGVRVPVNMTGMGEVARIRDAHDLAKKITNVLENTSRYLRPREEIEEMFSIEETVKAYDELFMKAMKH